MTQANLECGCRCLPSFSSRREPDGFEGSVLSHTRFFLVRSEHRSGNGVLKLDHKRPENELALVALLDLSWRSCERHFECPASQVMTAMAAKSGQRSVATPAEAALNGAALGVALVTLSVLLLWLLSLL
jgi:hypothetical protein